MVAESFESLATKGKVANLNLGFSPTNTCTLYYHFSSFCSIENLLGKRRIRNPESIMSMTSTL